MNIHLIRHPQPLEADGRCYGRTDLPASPDSLAATAAHLRELIAQPDLVISSPLQRCTALATTLTDDYETDARLVEISFGHWESRRWDDIDRAEFDHWAADYVHRSVPGGESWSDVAERVAAFLDDLRARSCTQVAVVTHAGVIRAILAAILTIPLEATWRIGVPFGCVVGIELGQTPHDDRLTTLSTGTPSR